MDKFTADQAREQEADGLIDALLTGAIALSDEFLTGHCSDKVREVLGSIPELDRAFHLDGFISGHVFNGFPVKRSGIHLPHVEIFVQFEGEASEYFADLDDWTIDGDCAYHYTGYGISLEIDTDGLKAAILEWNAV